MHTAGTSKTLTDTVGRALRGVRSFSKVYEQELPKDIKTLQAYLANRSEGMVLRSTLDLKAVSIIFDYEYSKGIPFTPRISTIGDAIFRSRATTIQKIFSEQSGDPSSRLMWMRQIVWVMLAHALWFHRNNKLHRMGQILTAAEELLDKKLLPEGDRPGTLARWNYYRGLQLRDQGDLEGAMEHFVQSFHYAQQRRVTKGEKLENDSLSKEDSEHKKAFEVEEAFTRACLARIQAFGFGEVAFFRGDLSGSSAWFRTALMTLEGEGLERWKLSVRVYLEGVGILNSPFTPEGAKRVEAAIKNVDALVSRLATLHRGYADLGRAFANLGRVRLGQMRSIELDSDHEGLQVDLEEEIHIPCQATREDGNAGNVNPTGRHGAISALISLISGEVLLRCNRTEDCRKEIRWIRSQLASNAFAQVEADLLEAQLHIVNKEWRRAARILERDRNLDYRANRNQRALWLALACTVQLKLKNSLSARILAHRARSVGNRVGDGFVKHFVQLAVNRALPESTSILAMPYQGEPPNLYLKDNLCAATRNLIQTAVNLTDSVKSPEELAPILGLGRAAIYEQVDKKLLDAFFKKRPGAKGNSGS